MALDLPHGPTWSKYSESIHHLYFRPCKTPTDKSSIHSGALPDGIFVTRQRSFSSHMATLRIDVVADLWQPWQGQGPMGKDGEDAGRPSVHAASSCQGLCSSFAFPACGELVDKAPSFITQRAARTDAGSAQPSPARLVSSFSREARGSSNRPGQPASPPLCQSCVVASAEDSRRRGGMDPALGEGSHPEGGRGPDRKDTVQAAADDWDSPSGAPAGSSPGAVVEGSLDGPDLEALTGRRPRARLQRRPAWAAVVAGARRGEVRRLWRPWL